MKLAPCKARVYSYCGRAKYFGRRAALHDGAVAHHDDGLADMGCDPQFLRDDQHGEPELQPQFVEQFENLFLHRDVERGDRSVGDQ